MKLEYGKRYVRRDGEVTGPLGKHVNKDFPFIDPTSGETYTKNGEFDIPNEGEVCGLDLVSEYETPTPPTLPDEVIEQAKRIQAINAGKAEVPTTAERAKSDIVGTGLILIPWYSILAIGKIFIEGLRYGRDNWKKGVKDPQYQEERLEHAMLHLIKWKEGDRSEAHLAKVAWFCVTQLELERLENCHALMPEKQPNPDM